MKEAVEYIYEEYCDHGKRRKLFGGAISLGAGVLANYVAKERDQCPLTAAVTIGCHFDTLKAMEFLKTNMFGFYDFILGQFCRMTSKPWIEQYDKISQKGKQDTLNLVAEKIEKVYTLSSDFSKIIARIAGYKSLNDYFTDADVTHRMKNIRIPTFFLNALDDPFYGPDVIPVSNSNEKVLIGVTKTGGHLCYFTGFLLPTGQWFVEPMFEYLNYFVQHYDEQEALRAIPAPSLRNKRKTAGDNLKPSSTLGLGNLVAKHNFHKKLPGKSLMQRT